MENARKKTVCRSSGTFIHNTCNLIPIKEKEDGYICPVCDKEIKLKTIKFNGAKMKQIPQHYTR